MWYGCRWCGTAASTITFTHTHAHTCTHHTHLFLVRRGDLQHVLVLGRDGALHLLVLGLEFGQDLLGLVQLRQHPVVLHRLALQVVALVRDLELALDHVGLHGAAEDVHDRARGDHAGAVDDVDDPLVQGARDLDLLQLVAGEHTGADGAVLRALEVILRVADAVENEGGREECVCGGGSGVS